MPRRDFSKKTKREAWERAGGLCEMVWDGKRCNLKLFPGNTEYDHIIEDARGGDASLENCQVICVPCHKAKTKQNRPDVDKTRRQSDMAKGIRSKSSWQSDRFKRDWRTGRVYDKQTGDPV